MDFVPLVAALALVWKIVDVVKYVRAKNLDAVITQVGVWFAGVVVIILLAATDFAQGVVIASARLSDLNVASLILIGLSIGSSASVLVDAKKALDNTDSAVVSSTKRD